MSEQPASAERAWLLQVGMRVRLARVRRRESQDVLAARAGVSRVTLGSIERGEHPAVVLSYVRLARALSLSMDELLDGAP
jgi:transcriptional regulator with XRE-family HTH domain